MSVRASRPSGLFTTSLYTTSAGGTQVPVWQLAVNSLLTWPVDGSAVGPAPQELHGWAWGHDAVAEVHVSVDRRTVVAGGGARDRAEGVVLAAVSSRLAPVGSWSYPCPHGSRHRRDGRQPAR